MAVILNCTPGSTKRNRRLRHRLALHLISPATRSRSEPGRRRDCGVLGDVILSHLLGDLLRLAAPVTGPVRLVDFTPYSARRRGFAVHDDGRMVHARNAIEHIGSEAGIL